MPSLGMAGALAEVWSISSRRDNLKTRSVALACGLSLGLQKPKLDWGSLLQSTLGIGWKLTSSKVFNLFTKSFKFAHRRNPASFLSLTADACATEKRDLGGCGYGNTVQAPA